jgi:hypothetical protein
MHPVRIVRALVCLAAVLVPLAIAARAAEPIPHGQTRVIRANRSLPNRQSPG